MECRYMGGRLLFPSAALADKHKVYDDARQRWSCSVSTSDTETQARHSLQVETIALARLT